MLTIENIKWFGGIAALGGLWVVVTPFLWPVPSAFRWTTVVVGLGIVLLAGYTAYEAHREARVRRYVAYLAGLAGLFVILSPYAFQVSHPNLLLNNFIVGGVIAALTGYSGYVAPALSARAPTGRAA